MCLFAFLFFFGRKMFFFMGVLGLLEITEWEPCPLLAGLDLRTDVEQPFDYLIVQNRPAPTGHQG